MVEGGRFFLQQGQKGVLGQGIANGSVQGEFAKEDSSFNVSIGNVPHTGQQRKRYGQVEVSSAGVLHLWSNVQGDGTRWSRESAGFECGINSSKRVPQCTPSNPRNMNARSLGPMHLDLHEPRSRIGKTDSVR